MRLQLQRCFDEGREEAGDEVPVYVAVECPDAYRVSSAMLLRHIKGLETLIWVVRYEAEGYVTTAIDFDNVPADGDRGRVDGCSSVGCRAGCRALYYLEVVTVYMERVTTCVIIVDHYLNCVVIV